MYGDPREGAQVRLLAKLQALTTTDGLPEPFRLVTRELKHFAELRSSHLPGCLLQIEEGEPRRHLSHVTEEDLPGRIVVLFPPTTTLPATVANAYQSALGKMIEEDTHLGGLIDQLSVKGRLMPGLWEEVNLLGVGILINMLFEYDPRLPPILA